MSLLDRVFGLFTYVDQEQTQSRMALYRHDEDVCEHQANGISLMSLPDAVTLHQFDEMFAVDEVCLLYTSPSPRDRG